MTDCDCDCDSRRQLLCSPFYSRAACQQPHAVRIANAEHAHACACINQACSKAGGPHLARHRRCSSIVAAFDVSLRRRRRCSRALCFARVKLLQACSTARGPHLHLCSSIVTAVAVLLRRRRQCSRERCFACVTFASLSLSCIIVAVAPVAVAPVAVAPVAVAPVAVAADAHARCCVRESNAVPGQHNLK